MTLSKIKTAVSNGSNPNTLEGLDRALIAFTSETAIPLLRISLGIVYVWFGALKIIGASPVADLVAKTAFLIPKELFVRLVGVLEVIIGIGLLLRAALHVTLPLFFLQLSGTFMLVFTHPQELFQNYNPLLLTKEGEFVLKNLVLLSAGLAVGRTAHREDETLHGPRGETTH